MPIRCLLVLLVLLAAMVPIAGTTAPRVVINEIHYDPADKRPLEFVELHNTTPAAVQLSGWALEKFSFPTDAILAPGGFVIIAQDPAVFAKEFGFQPLGPLPGKLSNGGEKLTLRDGGGKVVDEVKYGVGFPWPTAANGAGSSLERVHPALPSGNPGSWRSAGYPVVAPSVAGTVFIAAEDARWRWRKGTSEASQPRDAWRLLAFAEDSSWQDGRTSIGYEDGDDHTILTDMQDRYTSIFLRRTFVVSGKIPPALLLRVRVDDGCIVWINGAEVARFHVQPGEPSFNGLAENHEAGDEFEEVLLDQAARLLVTGTNLLAIQVFNASRTSSDLTIDAELRTPDGSPRGRRPTPGATNSVFTALAPPSIREVSHQPAQPKSSEPVKVTARLADPQGVREATLQLQVVEPGIYVRKGDAAFQTNWLSLPLHDDGHDGDLRAGDGVFTALVNGDLQRHRRLVRYRVSVTGKSGLTVRAPHADDSSPNFAWFVFDGLPAWTGASQPGRTPPVTFSAEFLRTIPAYHLLARADDVERSQWDGSANRRRFSGTLVFDGRVYDHIQFHNRGTGSAYISGKNKWGLKFNRAHEFAARDIHGRAYENAWDSLNLNPGLSTPYLPVHAGIAGLDEALCFRAFQLAGVPAANAHWVQWHVIDSAAESSPTNQYAGDLRGLYLAIQDMDGALLRERGLPDGNIYSMQSGRKHLARGAPADNSDWNEFLNGVRNEHSAPWWRTNLDLSSYYSFHAINRVIGNVDLRPDGNHGYYRRPDGRWAPFPWDHDMTLVPRTHQPGHIDAIRCLNAPALRIEFQNRAREILDLFCADPAPDGGQVGQLVDELSRILRPAGFTNDWGQLDAAVWNWHPRQNQKGLFYVNPNTGHHFGGAWKRTLASPDLAGFCRYIVEFCTDSRPTKNYAPNDGDQRGYGFGYLRHEAKDAAIPATPTVRYTGAPGFAVNQLAFEVTPFTSPRTNSLAAVQWRVGEISASAQPRRYEIEPHWVSEELAAAGNTFHPPPKVCATNHTYRVRARYKDNTGRWSHWSAPVPFVPRAGK
jgi:Lamin Tail Domain/CotH kinase protein